MRVFYVFCFALCVVVINCDNESPNRSKKVKKSVLPKKSNKRQGIGGYAASARGYPAVPQGGESYAQSHGAPRGVGGDNEYSSPPPSYGSVPSSFASRGGGSYRPYSEGPHQPNRRHGGGGDGFLHSSQHPPAIHMDQRDMQDFSSMEQPERPGGRGGYEMQGGSNGGNDNPEAPNGEYGDREPSEERYQGGGNRGYQGQQSDGSRSVAQRFQPDDGMTMSGFNNLGGQSRGFGGNKYTRSKILRSSKKKRKQSKEKTATKRSMLQRNLFRRTSTPGSVQQGNLQTRQLGQASMQPQQPALGSLQPRQLGPGMGGMQGMQRMQGMAGMPRQHVGGSMSHYHPINVGSEAIKHIQPAVPAINIAPQQKFIDIPATRGAITVQPRVPLVHLSAPRKTINALSHADAVHINSPSTVYHRPPIVFHKPQVVGCAERGLPPGCDDVGGENGGYGGYGGEYGTGGEEHARGEEEGDGSVSSYGQRDEVPLGVQYGEYQKRDRIQAKKRTKSKKHHKKNNKARRRRFEIAKPIEHVQSQNERRSPKPSDKDDAPVFFVDGTGSMHRVNNDVANNPINLLHPPCFGDSGAPCLGMEPHSPCQTGGMGGVGGCDFSGQGLFHGGGDVRGYGAGLAGGSPCDHHGCDHHGMPLGGAFAASAYGEHTEPGTSVVGSPLTTGNAGVTAGHLPLMADVPVQTHMSPAYAHYPTIGDGQGRSTHPQFPGISNIGVNPGAHGDMRFHYSMENAIPEHDEHMTHHGGHGGFKKKSLVARLEDSIEEDELDKSTERVSKSMIPREEDDHVRVHKDAIPRPYMM